MKTGTCTNCGYFGEIHKVRNLTYTTGNGRKKNIKLENRLKLCNSCMHDKREKLKMGIKD